MHHKRRSSPLHSARALAGGAWCLTLGAFALAFEHPVLLAGLLGVVLFAAWRARVLAEVERSLAWALPFALAIALVNALVSREGLTVVAFLGEWPWLGRLDVTLEGLLYGLVLGLRAVVVIAAFSLYSAAVDPDQLLRGFRRLGARSALTAALATRMVGVLSRDARRMADAQRSRSGATPPRLLVARSVAVNALDRASDVAATLEVRGYRLGSGPARLRAAWTRPDLAFAASAAALVMLGAWGLAAGAAAFEAYPRTRAPLTPELAALAGALAAVALAPFALRRGVAA